jgi:hypothetical protein
MAWMVHVGWVVGVGLGVKGGGAGGCARRDGGKGDAATNPCADRMHADCLPIFFYIV